MLQNIICKLRLYELELITRNANGRRKTFEESSFLPVMCNAVYVQRVYMCIFFRKSMKGEEGCKWIKTEDYFLRMWIGVEEERLKSYKHSVQIPTNHYVPNETVQCEMRTIKNVKRIQVAISTLSSGENKLFFLLVSSIKTIRNYFLVVFSKQ